jgi:8-oxo-dGTP diphosphatase
MPLYLDIPKAMAYPFYLLRGNTNLLKIAGQIPGGFVLESESLEEAVKRELQEETGISVNYLE